MQKKVDYTQAIKNKYPEQIIYAVAKDKAGKPNPMTIGWTMIASGDPPMMAIAVAHKRYTAEAVRYSKCFTIVFPASDASEEALFFGTKSGRDTDKIAEMNTPVTPAEKIDSVLLTDAVANFECTLESETVAGDHVIFVGRIVTSHINTEKKKRLYSLNPDGLMGPVN
ncbi:MAG: flavin reductase family protein [Planctomycetota bacterium]